MLSTNKTLLLSSLCAALLVTACNDSEASSEPKSAAAPAAAAAAASDLGVDLVTSSSDINQRNHVCFTMDVNNGHSQS